MNTGYPTVSIETLHRMWNTRPARFTQDGTVAGVCAGIARRYRVDPTLVKVAFVVATLFGGSGVVVYILAWIALPANDDAPADRMIRRERRALDRHVQGRAARAEYRRARRHGHRGSLGRSHGRPPTIVVIVIALVVLTSFTPNIAWGSGGVLGAALLALGWLLLHQRCPDPEPGTSADTLDTGVGPAIADPFTRWTPRAWTDAGTDGRVQDTPGRNDTQSAEDTVDLSKGATATDPTRPVTPVPPSWDPLGVAPFAWDLPEPSVPPPPPTPARRRSALVPVTLGVALLTIAATTTAMFAGVDAVTPARIAASALAVVSVGLVVGAATRRGSGLVPVAVLLAVVVVAASAATGPGSIPGGGAGDRDWRPLTENDIAAEYQLTVGSGTLDLRSVTLTADRTVRVRVGLGEAKVIAPTGMNVDTRCRTTVGEEKCPGGIDGGSDGTAGPVLRIEASSIVGHVEVSRG